MSGSNEKFAALVLAGRRGASDAFADALAASDPSGHHALLDVAGVPMLLRVVRTLKASPSVGRITVSIDDPAVLDGVPELRASLADGSLACRTATPRAGAWRTRWGTSARARRSSSSQPTTRC
jgi:hypothetical protein